VEDVTTRSSGDWTHRGRAVTHATRAPPRSTTPPTQRMRFIAPQSGIPAESIQARAEANHRPGPARGLTASAGAENPIVLCVRRHIAEFARGALALVPLAAQAVPRAPAPNEEYIVGEFSNSLDASLPPMLVISERSPSGYGVTGGQGGLVRFTVTSARTTPPNSDDAGGLARCCVDIPSSCRSTDTIRRARQTPSRCEPITLFLGS